MPDVWIADEFSETCVIKMTAIEVSAAGSDPVVPITGQIWPRGNA